MLIPGQVAVAVDFMQRGKRKRVSNGRKFHDAMNGSHPPWCALFSVCFSTFFSPFSAAAIVLDVPLPLALTASAPTGPCLRTATDFGDILFTASEAGRVTNAVGQRRSRPCARRLPDPPAVRPSTPSRRSQPQTRSCCGDREVSVCPRTPESDARAFLCRRTRFEQDQGWTR